MFIPVIAVFLVLNLTSNRAESYEVTKLRYSPECILKVILSYRKIEFRPDIKIPRIRYESQTTLAELNQALYPSQWSTPAKYFSNAYAYKNGLNEIFLTDNAAYYKKHDRYIDDSLAHELFHFIQIKYKNMDITTDDFAEFDAIFVQNWFRDTIMLSPQVTTTQDCPN